MKAVFWVGEVNFEFLFDVGEDEHVEQPFSEGNIAADARLVDFFFELEVDDVEQHSVYTA